jgi:hypothetical protein
MVSEQDYLVLLEADLGVGLMPESTMRSSRLACVPVSGLDLSRTISVYAVAGRQRPLAVSTSSFGQATGLPKLASPPYRETPPPEGNGACTPLLAAGTLVRSQSANNSA